MNTASGNRADRPLVVEAMASALRTLPVWFLLLLPLALPVCAEAEDALARGIDPVLAKPALSIDGLLTLEGARTEPRGSWQLALDADLAAGLLAWQVGDERRGDLIERRLDLHLHGAWAVTDGIEVAADLPLTAWQRDGFGRLEAETGFPADAPASGGIGDVRLLGKARLLDEETAPVTAAIVAEVRAPTGRERDFLGERGWTLSPRVAVERTFGEEVRLAGEAGFRWRETAGRYLNLHVGSEVVFGAGASVALPAAGPVTRWAALAEFTGSTPARAPFRARGDSLVTALEALAGLRVGLGGCFEATLAGGTGIAADAGLGRESWRVLAGLRCTRIRHDRDGDGIEDAVDTCPDVPEDLDGFADADGCPDPDDDEDGVPDAADACPQEPGAPDLDGCPDADRDEIPDREDRCPQQPGPAQNDGCPAEAPYVRLGKDRIDLTAAVRFDSGRDTVTADSKPVLDEVAAVLRAHPELRRVRIEGHTDAQGSDTFNLDLSKRRARTVVSELVRRGIAAARLDSEGFGESRPIADNATALGRAKNRRVELAIVERVGR